MSGSQAMTFSKQDLQTIIKQNQISPNKLATLLALDEKAAGQDQPSDNSNLSLDELVKENNAVLLEQLVQPYNLSFITAVNNNDDFFFTSLVAGETSYLYYGEEAGSLTLKETNPEEAATLLGDFIGVADIVKTGTHLTMSMDGLLAFGCLLDRLKRQRLENLVLHVVEEESLTPQSMEEEFAIALETKDLRWTLPFLLEAFDVETTLDLAKGLKELASLGITTKAKKQVEVTPLGVEVAALFQEPRGMLGVKSLYYHKQSLILDPLVFFRVSGYLYAVQGGESVTWASVGQAQYQEMMSTVLAPGEAPTLINHETAPAAPQPIKEEAVAEGILVDEEPVLSDDTGQKKKPRPKFCRFCGTPLKARGKFCHSCGKEIGS